MKEPLEPFNISNFEDKIKKDSPVRPAPLVVITVILIIAMVLFYFAKTKGASWIYQWLFS